MIVMKQYIDLSLIDNQKLVAQDWIIYRDRIIINEELRFIIEGFYENYNMGILTKTELFHLTLDAIYRVYNSVKN